MAKKRVAEEGASRPEKAREITGVSDQPQPENEKGPDDVV